MRIHLWIQIYQNNKIFTFTNFLNNFEKAFFNNILQQKALFKLFYMKQNNRIFNDFFSKFDKVLSKISEVKFADAQKKNIFKTNSEH